MGFTRTTSGQIAEYLFYTKPLVWVEGREDVPFYSALLRSCQCHIKPAGGRNECLKLAAAVIGDDYPYVVVIDGDYGVLVRKQSPHRRVVFLNRYSIESYLFEHDPAERVTKDLAKIDPGEKLLSAKFEQVVNYAAVELEELVVLDIAHQRTDSPEQVFPKRAEEVLSSGGGSAMLKFNKARISHLCSKAHQTVATQAVHEARILVTAFLRERRLVDLVRGHFVFGLLRRLISTTVEKETGKRPYLNDDGLLALLSSALWSLTPPSKDHINLRRRLLRALRDTGRG